jgi:S-adenosylmethionine:tRNA ribosyltransferase-isomerase
MLKVDFDYFLPPSLIAQAPAQPRGASRLLHLDGASGACTDRQFADLPQLLRAGDLLVCNDTRVIPARLFGAKESGGRIEVLIERLLGERCALAQIHASKSPKPGTCLLLDGGVTLRVLGRRNEFFELEFEGQEPVPDVLERIGHVPLPPYIDRPDSAQDRLHYQTVFARAPGAVAAPTAGLHFDEAMLARLRDMQVHFGYVTLHVGAGTFQPLRVDEVEQHRLHSERMCVSAEVCAQIQAARREGRRVVAVGTTVVRALESAARDGELKPFDGETDIFIYPGFRFRVVDALVTNFHLPQSTLLMLVCAFGGTEQVLGAYRHAVEAGYRFYSYGDAMFVSPNKTIEPPRRQE